MAPGGHRPVRARSGRPFLQVTYRERMSMPPPQQNPYGQPSPHSPYGQHPLPQQNPYAQQPPYPPQQPVHGYPQQPQGAPGPWGNAGGPGWPQQHMQPQPPRRNRAGLVVGIVLGALVLVLAVGFGAFALLGNGATTAFPEATHKLVVDKTVLKGEFTLTQDLSDTEGKEIEEAPDPTVRGGKAALAQYGSEENGMLVLSGLYGRLSDPSLMRTKILEGVTGAEGTTVAVPPEEFRPAGYDITVECQVVKIKEIGLTVNKPVCAWADGNTAAMVSVLRTGDLDKDAQSVDLDKAAEETAQVRSELRRPIS